MDGSADQVLLAWARAHHGLYRTADAITAGLTKRQIRYRVRQGRAEQIGLELYRVLGTPVTQDQRDLAAAWRASGVVSHRTAMERHGLLPRSIHTPHVTVWRRMTHSLDDVVIHRSTDLLEREVSDLRGVPTTTPARTLVDVGLQLPVEELDRAVHRSIHLGLTSYEQLATTYDRVARQGRHGCGPLRAVLSTIDADSAVAESDLEVILLDALRRFGVQEPIRQHQVVVDGERFRLDLAYPQQRLFLEGDGFGIHGLRDDFEHDRRRQNLLVVHGWWPLRFTWRQIRQQPEWCADTVRRKLVALDSGRG